MLDFWMEQGAFLGQILLAGLCGIIIGAERQSRMKSAGVRTHFMVAVAASLMMIISKYGFMDVIVVDGVDVDASRVAAGIITGIGILGGGLIFTGKEGLVSGMTTAAGIWVTVGIGMSIGSGMIVLGLAVTVLVRIMQFFLHRNMKICKEVLRGQIVFTANREPEAVQKLVSRLEEMDMEVGRVKRENREDGSVLIICNITLKPGSSRKDFSLQIADMEQVISYEI